MGWSFTLSLPEGPGGLVSSLERGVLNPETQKWYHL